MSDPHGDDVQHYPDPGISEHHGRIPVWLRFVYGVMALWMVWYLISFWSDRG